ncbi:hypothetical protein [Streptomyces albus]|uniref:hypothetical protein n=1 Tax=Streptomyces albus TaxID=1888 RepID=UPI0024E112A9|nr:hypothetical protein [Streptomyces albus]GHJ21115.1 hypothetical protein TPA0909_27290 [Streptomyces albus]
MESSWEDAVEVSFRPAGGNIRLAEFDGAQEWPLDLEPISYRVRYCAAGMDRGQAEGTNVDDPPVDHYLLQFWPAPPRPAEPVRITSRSAACRHRSALGQPPPPTPEEQAEAERAARLREEQTAEERRLAVMRQWWGGRLPGEALRRVGRAAFDVARVDVELAHALGSVTPERQRAVARLAVHRAYTVAGPAPLDWVAPALAAMAEGRALPAPFDDEDRAWDVLEGEQRIRRSTVRMAVPPPDRPAVPLLLLHDAAPGRRATAEPPSLPGTEPGQAPPPGQAGARAWPGPGEPVRLVPPQRIEATAPHPLPGDSPAPSHRPAPCAPSQGQALRAEMVRADGVGQEQSLVSRPHAALPALFRAVRPDSLSAAFGAVGAAIVTYGEDYPALLEEVWAMVRGV